MKVSPQFEQHGLFPETERRDPKYHWDAARAAHHLGTAEMPYDGGAARLFGDYTPELAAKRPEAFKGVTPERIREAHQHVDHDTHWYEPLDKTMTPHQYRGGAAGQLAMTTHGGELHANLGREVDHHGNIEAARDHPDWDVYAPQHNKAAAAVFAEHGREVDLHPHTPLYTAQHADQTDDISGITGPKVHGSVPVVMHEGMPYLMDGHHRRAAAAARGQVIKARVVSKDQLDRAGVREHWQPDY